MTSLELIMWMLGSYTVGMAILPWLWKYFERYWKWVERKTK